MTLRTRVQQILEAMEHDANFLREQAMRPQSAAAEVTKQLAEYLLRKADDLREALANDTQ